MAVSNPGNALAVPPGLRGRAVSPQLEPLVRLLRTKPLATFGLVILGFMVAAAVLAPVLAPADPTDLIPGGRLKPPLTEGFLFGTDNFGRDMLSRLLHGARISLSVAVAVVLIGTTLATLLGAVVGYAGGKLDMVVGRFVDAFMALPQLVVLLTIMAVLGPGLINVIIALSARAAITESRIVRSAIVSVKQLQYIDAARALGASPSRILFLHALPNVMAPIIIIATTALGSAILAEASLSFLGAGVPPPAPTWGGMLSGEGRRFMIVAPWMAIFPGLALSLSVFGINVLGDGLRDVFDPRLRGGGGRFK